MATASAHIQAPSAAVAGPEDDGFIARLAFDGARSGYSFKMGPRGLGYYKLPVSKSELPPPRKRTKTGAHYNSPVPGLAPPVVKAGDYVLCAYYPRDIFLVKRIRKSLSGSPPFWSVDITNPKLLGEYNWVSERYLTLHHPGQGELNFEQPNEWYTTDTQGGLSTLSMDGLLEVEAAKVNPEKAAAHRRFLDAAAATTFKPNGARLSGGSSPRGGSPRSSASAGVVVFQGHSLKVSGTTPPCVPIRDLIALMCGMDSTDKGSLNIRNSFFDRGFMPKLTHRFPGSSMRFDTPVVQWTEGSIDTLVAFCDNKFRSGRFSQKMTTFRDAKANKWSKLDALVTKAASEAGGGKGGAAASRRIGVGGIVRVTSDNAALADGTGSDTGAGADGSGGSGSGDGSGDDGGTLMPSPTPSLSSAGGDGGSPRKQSGGTGLGGQQMQQHHSQVQRGLGAAAVAAVGSTAGGYALQNSPSPRSGHALVGRKVRKYWPGAGWYDGTVIDDYIDGKGKQRMYSVKFDDGDKEDYTFQELNRILVPDTNPLLVGQGAAVRGGDDHDESTDATDKISSLLSVLQESV